MIYNILHWPERHPKIWRWYQTITLTLNFLAILLNAWAHDLTWMLIFLGFSVLAIWMIHRHIHDDDDDQDDDNEPEDWPDGEDAEKWLRSRLRIVK